MQVQNWWYLKTVVFPLKFLQLQWPNWALIFSVLFFFMYMLDHRKCGYWSLTITNVVHMLESHWTLSVNSIVQGPHKVSQLLYTITNLWKFRLNRSSESGEINGKTHSCFRTFCRVMTFVQNKFVILAIENWYCFNVFSKSKAFHGIFQEKSFTITFCKPCKLFVNLCFFLLFFLYRKCIMALNKGKVKH